MRVCWLPAVLQSHYTADVEEPRPDDQSITSSSAPTERLAINIKCLREAHGWTQEELAKQSGISTKAVLTIENRPEVSRLSSLIAVANALRVHPADLLSLTPERHQQRLDPIDLSEALITLGQALQRSRHEHGLSLRELARMTQVSHISLNRYEIGTRDMPLGILFYLTNMLGVAENELLSCQKESS